MKPKLMFLKTFKYTNTINSVLIGITLLILGTIVTKKLDEI